MARWRQLGKVWCYWPARPEGIIEMIGGSYLSASPHISYRNLLSNLSADNMAVHAYSYIPGFDHQNLANDAWLNLRKCRKDLQLRTSLKPYSIRLGHSLGCKLHLLAPDGGRSCQGLIAIAFNNYSARNSIPMLKELSPKLGLKAEFQPSPMETMRLIAEQYIQPRNLLISFVDDNLDQNLSLLQNLQARKKDSTSTIKINGNHLTPASLGLRGKILEGYETTSERAKNLKKLIQVINNWGSNYSRN